MRRSFITSEIGRTIRGISDSHARRRTSLPLTWLAKTGWRKHGLLGFEEKPKE